MKNKNNNIKNEIVENVKEFKNNSKCPKTKLFKFLKNHDKEPQMEKQNTYIS